jgi:hypothetical protein
MKWLIPTWFIGVILLIWLILAPDNAFRGFLDCSYGVFVFLRLILAFINDFSNTVSFINWLRASPRSGTISKNQLPIL